MEPEPTTYACPHCAERIQRQAVACRFCDRPVTWTLFLIAPPPALPLPTVLKRLYEEFGRERYTSYGAMRKSQKGANSPLLQGLTRQEADEAAAIITEHQGEARVELDPDEFSPSATAQKKKRPALQFLLAAVALALLTALYFQQKKKVEAPTPPPIAIAPLESPSTEASTKPTPNVAPTAQPPKAVTSEGPSNEMKLHLHSLIAATATLSGNGVTGSAFFIHSSGYLITNNHVTQRMKNISVQTSDGKNRPGRLIQADPHLDLALIKADGGPYPTLTLGDATTLEQGEAVWTIGAPHGLSFTVTRGIVSYVGRKVKGKAYIQADVAINPGNSGGPMINEKGEVVAVNNFIISNAVGLNFAIPINYVYMGDDCIAEEVIPTMRDNSTMSTWRSWDENQPYASRSTSGEYSSTDETERLVQTSLNFQREHDQRRDKRNEALSKLNRELEEKKRRYDSRSATISEEAKLGNRIRQLTQQIYNEQLSQSDDTLDYCSQQEATFNQILSTAQDENLSLQVRTQIQRLQQLRSSTQSGKEQIQIQLDTLDKRVY